MLGRRDVFTFQRRVDGSRSRDVWTVSLEGLARMKRLAGRPQDLADLDNLGLEREEGS